MRRVLLALTVAVGLGTEGTGTTWAITTDRVGTDEGAAPSQDPKVSSDERFVVFESEVALVPNDLLRLVSTSDGGVKGNAASQFPDVSADAARMGFNSSATNLDPFDTDAVSDVYLKEFATDDLTLVSTSDTWAKGNGDSTHPSLSDTGTRVAFQSTATNLDPADADATLDVYVKDVLTGDIRLATTSDGGVKSNGYSDLPDLAGGGLKVAFRSRATNLDPADGDSVLDAYVKNVGSGDIVLASTSTSGTKSNADVTGLAISPSGQRVAFDTRATNLDPLDTDALVDVYVKRLSDGMLILASTSDTGEKGNGNSYEISLSETGSQVAFSSGARNLDASDTDTTRDVFVKDLSTGDVMLVSTSDTGEKGNGTSFDPKISADGTRVAFTSEATNLDPADPDPGIDVYVKDLVTGDIALASATSEGVKGDERSYQPTISDTGRRVGFVSESTNLDPADTDATLDVYVKQPAMCSVAGTAGDDVLSGGPRDDVICGRGGHDTINGRGGDDVLLGEAGNDVLIGAGGADELDGGADEDAVSYEGSPLGVVVNIGSGYGEQGDAEGDMYVAIENAVGSSHFDQLFGDAGPNELLGRGTEDVLSGGEGDDVLSGQGGPDHLTGGPGGDALDGGGDIDTVTYSESSAGVSVDLSAGTGSGGNAEGDTLVAIEALGGTDFADVLTGDGSTNTIAGGAGDDVLTGSGGADVLEGSAGLDISAYAASPAAVTAQLATQTVAGGDATGDVITSIEGILGSAFDDVLTGDAADNVFMGMAGADAIDGAGGVDGTHYLYSNAAVTVDLTAQTVSGGHATGDTISGIENTGGSTFADVLWGDAGTNVLDGYAGADTLIGRDGDDTLTGGEGADSFFGGTGTDTCDDAGGEPVSSCEVRYSDGHGRDGRGQGGGRSGAGGS